MTQKDLDLLKEIEAKSTKRMLHYEELKDWLKSYFKDGVITKNEMTAMTFVRNRISLTFQTTYDLMKGMSPGSPQYAAAQEVAAHAYQCWMLMDSAVEKGAVYDQLTPEQKMNRDKRENNKETLDIKLPGLAATAWKEADRYDEKIKPIVRLYEQNAQEIDPKMKEEARLRVADAIKAQQKEQLSALQMNQILGLQRG